MTEKEIWEALKAPMPFKLLPKPVGQKEEALALPYIEAEQVIKRLNEVLGLGNWQEHYNIVKWDADYVSMVCSLMIKLDNEWIHREGYGEAKGEDKENFKAAESDAFKRAARKYGVGLFLYEIPLKFFPYDPNSKKWKLSQEEMIKQLMSETTPKETFVCADCGKEIMGGKSKTGKEYTAQDVVDYSLKTFGRILCPACQKKAKDEQNN